MPSFSDRSRARLETCHPDLVALFTEVIRHVDCTVLEGVRSDERQAELYRTGKSKVDGVTTRSQHQVKSDGYSHAVDVAPYPIDWEDAKRFAFFAGYVHATADRLGIKIRWGGDWDGDGNQREHSFWDAPHYEIAR